VKRAGQKIRLERREFAGSNQTKRAGYPYLRWPQVSCRTHEQIVYLCVARLYQFDCA
jgi:hypothetical protein